MPRQVDERVADLAKGGHLLVALFLPQYFEDPVTHELRGRGTGAMGTEISRHLATYLDAEMQIVGYPTPAAAVDGLNTGSSHLAFMGIEPARAVELDFSPPVFEFDYTLLVPANSKIARVADIDRPDIRIAVVRTHASTLALRRIVTQAELVGFDLPDASFHAFESGACDAMAFPRDVLLEYSRRLPGSRVLEDAYGTNRVGVAIPKGHPDWLNFLREFVQSAKASGLIERFIVNTGVSGFRVA